MSSDRDPVEAAAGSSRDLYGVATWEPRSAGLVAEINSGLKPSLAGYGLMSSVLYYFLVVGPGEEAVKLLAVRLLPYGSDRFTTVLDGAMAGMGFAFIENAIYIRRSLAVPELEFGLWLLATGGAITTTRAIAGPGHVIYSAFAGYYLGLAKFNPEKRGPLVLKGILIAAALQGLYNATIGFGSAVVGTVTGLSGMGAFLVYVLLFDGLWGAVLCRKVERYRAAYNAVDDGRSSENDDTSTEAAARSDFEFGTADGERER